MKTLKARLERIEVEEPVHIPSLDGTGIAETITAKVPAWRDPKDGEVYLDTEAIAILDKVKARHLGLLTPGRIKALRQRLELTQPQISELLQIVEKTWTRWETGRERPSRSINVLLSALNDGKLDVACLQTVARSWNDEISPREEVPSAPRHPHHASLGGMRCGRFDDFDNPHAAADFECGALPSVAAFVRTPVILSARAGKPDAAANLECGALTSRRYRANKGALASGRRRIGRRGARAIPKKWRPHSGGGERRR